MRYLVVLLAMFVAACGGGPTGPVGLVRFADRDIDVGDGRSGQFQLTNNGSEPVSGITFDSEGTLNSSGTAVEGARLTILTGSLGPLDPGRKFSFPFRIEVTTLPPGSYSIELRVLVDGEESDRAKIRFFEPEPR